MQLKHGTERSMLSDYAIIWWGFFGATKQGIQVVVSQAVVFVLHVDNSVTSIYLS